MLRNETIHFSRSVMITDTESESLSKQGKEFDMSFNHTLVKILSKGLVVKVTVIIVINNSNKLGLSSAEKALALKQVKVSHLMVCAVNIRLQFLTQQTK